MQHILDDAQNRLVALDRQAVLAEAAAILANSETPLVVVCDEHGTAVGVLSRTDIMRALAATNDGEVMATPAQS